MSIFTDTARIPNPLLIVLLLLVTIACDNEITLDEFTSNRGRFSIMPPGELDKKVESIKTPIGSMSMITFTLNEPDTSYLVAYVDYPDTVMNSSNPKTMLDGARDGMLAKIDGILLSEELVEYGEDPARELHYKVKGDLGLGHMVLLLSGRRLYQVGAIGEKDKFPAVKVKRFIDSFEIW